MSFMGKNSFLQRNIYLGRISMDSWDMLDQMRNTLNEEEEKRRIQQIERAHRRNLTAVIITSALIIGSSILLLLGKISI